MYFSGLVLSAVWFGVSGWFVFVLFGFAAGCLFLGLVLWCLFLVLGWAGCVWTALLFSICLC